MSNNLVTTPILLCPGSTFNNQNCTTNPSCPDGTKVSNSSELPCEGNVEPICGPNTNYNSLLGGCVVSPACPTGTTINTTTNKCTSSPVCNSDSKMVNGVCLSINKPTWDKCPLGTILDNRGEYYRKCWVCPPDQPYINTIITNRTTTTTSYKCYMVQHLDTSTNTYPKCPEGTTSLMSGQNLNHYCASPVLTY